MRNFQDTFQTCSRSFIIDFSVCMTVPLIVHNLYKLSELHERVSTEAAAHWCSIAALKNQKEPLPEVLQNRCS